ncbi:MAG: hypothetical protein JW818_09785 [Pirellulales bacterium]|nr:hypothetical protein [Pirellulales bacterium]
MMDDEKAKQAKMMAEYHRLRKLAHELDVQSATVHQRLAEIERQLPDDDGGYDDATAE